MHYLNLKQTTNRSSFVSEIAGFLIAGKVAVLPTDTIYGLSCLASHHKAIARIYRLKKRLPDRPFIILVSSIAMARRYVYLSSDQATQLTKLWTNSKRPTTLIFKGRNKLALNTDSLALRLPKSDLLIKIIRKIGQPIVSTSLNISTQATINNLSDLVKVWPDKRLQPDLVVDDGPARQKKPSRIIDLRGPKVIVVRK